MESKRDTFIKLKIPLTEALKAQEAYPNLSITQAVIQQLTISNEIYEGESDNESTRQRPSGRQADL